VGALHWLLSQADGRQGEGVDFYHDQDHDYAWPRISKES
jgi:hypothetical protein